MRRTWYAFAVLLLVACGGRQTTTTTPPATAPPVTPPPPVPTPSPAPGPRTVEVTATGLGSYLETTVPVAILRSASTGEVASQVTVHLSVTTPAHRPLASSDVSVSAIAPGSSVVVTARLGGALRGDLVVATVAVGEWTAASTTPVADLAASPGPPSCNSCSRGGSGTVLVTVSGDTQSGLLEVGAACRDAAGSIVGGGSALHAGGPSPVSVSVPIILSAPAAGCAEVSAVFGSF
jgi:hypothetical protein